MPAACFFRNSWRDVVLDHALRLQRSASWIVGIDTYALVGGHFGVHLRRDDRVTREDIDLSSNDFQPAIFGDETAVVSSSGGQVEAFEFRNKNDGAERNHGRVDSDGSQGRDGCAQCSATCRKPRWIEAFEANFLARTRARLRAIAVAFCKTDRFSCRQSSAALDTHAVVKVTRDVGDEFAGRVVNRSVFGACVFAREVVIRVAKSFTAAEIQRFASALQHEFHGRFRRRRRGWSGGHGDCRRAILFRRRSVCPSS